METEPRKPVSRCPAGAHGLHGLLSMRLLIPSVKNLDVLNERGQFGIGHLEQSRPIRWRTIRTRRFAPGQNDGAPPRAPPSFRLRRPRFAERQFWFWRGKGEDWDGRASRWLSASRCWRCRPSQPRIGLGNRLPGFWSDRTPLAHVMRASRSRNHICNPGFE